MLCHISTERITPPHAVQLFWAVIRSCSEINFLVAIRDSGWSNESRRKLQNNRFLSHILESGSWECSEHICHPHDAQRLSKQQLTCLFQIKKSPSYWESRRISTNRLGFYRSPEIWVWFTGSTSGDGVCFVHGQNLEWRGKFGALHSIRISLAIIDSFSACIVLSEAISCAPRQFSKSQFIFTFSFHACVSVFAALHSDNSRQWLPPVIIWRNHFAFLMFLF